MNLGIKDDAFVRGNVPMTKEEIRILTLVKAQIAPDAVVYDVGAGTGSLSVEAAHLALQGHRGKCDYDADGLRLSGLFPCACGALYLRGYTGADQSVGTRRSLRYGKGTESDLYHYGTEKVRNT